jgi:hypothetical protein
VLGGEVISLAPITKDCGTPTIMAPIQSGRVLL